MHVRTESALRWRGVQLGDDRLVLGFNKRERAVFAQASRLADQARNLARERVGFEWEYSDEDMELAAVEYSAKELAESGLLVLMILEVNHA